MLIQQDNKTAPLNFPNEEEKPENLKTCWLDPSLVSITASLPSWAPFLARPYLA